MEDIYLKYSANNMAKLKQIIYKSVSVFGEKEGSVNYDDFLSRANVTLWQLVKSFDETKGVPFEAYLRKRISLKMMQEETLQNRDVRTQYVRDKNGKKIKDENGKYIEIKPIYFDAPSEDGLDLTEKLASDFDLESELSEEIGLSKDDKVEKYLNCLSRRQRKIVILLSEGYIAEEIKELLHISNKEYMDNMLGIKAYENVRILM